MSARDLCVELWLEILSYVPKSAIYKLLGLNPLLSELALDKLYDDVAFVGYVRETKTMFDQVMIPDIARRVRAVLIELEHAPDTLSESHHLVEHMHKSGIDCMVPSSMETLTMAQIALSRFPCITTLRIKVHDHNMTRAFGQFLATICPRKTCPLQHLSIDTTVSHLAVWLDPLERLLQVYSDLETFHLALTRSDVVWMHQFHAKRVFTSLFAILQQHLTSLTIADPLIMRLPGLFATLPVFRRLKAFELITTFMSNMQEVDEPDSSTLLTRFIQDHSDTLESLTVEHRSTDPYACRWSSPYVYTTWLLSLEPLAEILTVDRPHMPRLKNLRVGFHGIPLKAGASRERLFPQLNTFAPNLVCLDITNSPVLPMHLQTIIDHLPTYRGVRSLQKLVISVTTLNCNDVDALAVKLPKLRDLEIVVPFCMSLREDSWGCQVVYYPPLLWYRMVKLLQERPLSHEGCPSMAWASLTHFRLVSFSSLSSRSAKNY
ncbi:hypothetical protein CVT24_004435 [Panaeolus cyanescens]|uniref:F-box domain-containing protein n=1 Tax=Panaeolus cyanescens TaxID=181874 RepID=A0A409VA23_9AGAR|nr:hypothetical protein CVT24_004435 [Panaeolus cyanescens]